MTNAAMPDLPEAPDTASDTPVDTSADTSAAPAMTQDQAAAALAEMKADDATRTILMQKSHPKYKATLEKWNGLIAAKAGTAAAPDDAPSSGDEAVPNELTDYKIDHAGPEHSKELESEARVMFHNAGVPVTVAHTLTQMWNQSAAEPPTPERRGQMMAETRNTLQAEWGDGYQANIDAVRKLIESAGPRAMQMLDSSGLCNNLYVVRQLHRIARGKASRR